jgi:glycosyltransferase involved in cell wall biosynthesis
MLEHVLQRAGEFDLVHFHTGHLHFPLVRRQPVPHLSTLHWRVDLPELASLHREFSDLPIVAISDAQRSLLATRAWRGTVHHGLPADRYRLQSRPGRYLAFVGRISPEKGVHDAIAIARAAGMPLRIAAKIETADLDYYEDVFKPLLADPLVEFAGEIDDDQKQAFLGNAYALLFPIRWPEPFGIVMIEAMACGTPVVAFRAGSVPEVIEDGVSGFIVDDIEGAVGALPRVAGLDRARCREAFERRFTARRMAQDYVALYEAVLAEQRAPGPVPQALDARASAAKAAPSSAVAGM